MTVAKCYLVAVKLLFQVMNQIHKQISPPTPVDIYGLIYINCTDFYGSFFSSFKILLIFIF